MNAVELEHPTGAVLSAYGLGQLNEEELAGIDEHLAGCAACRQVVQGVAPDTFLMLLRSAATEPDSSAGAMPEGAPGAEDGNGVPGAEVLRSPGAVSRALRGFGVPQSRPRVAPRVGPRGEAVVEPPPALTDHPRYRVGELLGVGGMGAVYRAEHLLMQRPVAVKVLNHELIANPATIERFRREVRAAARLTHPNIVAAFDAEQAGDVHFLAMEYVEGVSLARRCAEYGPLPVAEACSYARQAALGLQHAHECGMVHRDIKPQNLMLTPGGQVKILDFGLARFVMESAPAGALLPTEGEPAPTSGLDSKAKPLTQIGVVMGTPDYIAPEQAQDSHQADIRADIYSLGCTLYDMLAGHAPFPEGSAAQKVKAHQDRTPKPLRDFRSDVPSELARVVGRMMAKDPAQRFQTPVEVADALAPFLGAPPQPPRARKWLLPAALAGLAAALLAGVTIYVQTDRGRIIIETNDDKIAVMIEKAGGVKIVDQANKREYLLQPGEHDVRTGNYRIDVKETLAGLEFSTPEFKLTRGGEVRVVAKFVPAGPIPGTGGQNIELARTKKIGKSFEYEWGVREDPDGDCTFGYQVGIGRLTIKIPGTAHILTAELGRTNAPRVLRDVEGDFQAEVTVLGPFPSDAHSLVPRRYPFYSAGLLVWQDDKNYTRLERARMYYPNVGWRCFANWQQHRDGKTAYDLGDYATSLDERLPTFLRLEREGNTLTASYSQDGKEWKKLPPIKTDLGKKFRMGVTAIQNTPAGYEAVFENFKGAQKAPTLERKRANDRLESLKEIAGLNEIMYRQGKLVFDQVLAAKRDVAKAELDLCESDAERVKIYAKIVALAQELVKLRDAQYQAAQIPKVVALKAKADLLGALDDLNRAKAKAATRDTDLPKQASGDQGPLFGGKPASFWLQQLKDTNPKFRVEAVNALGMIAQKNKDLIPALVGGLKDREGSVARTASLALGYLGAEAVPGLLEVLKDKTSPNALRNAADAVGRIGPEAKAAVPLLADALKMDNGVVRQSAVIALGRVGPEAKSAMPALIDILGDYLKSLKFPKSEPGQSSPSDQSKTSFEVFISKDAFLVVLSEALSKIDPEIRDLLPKNAEWTVVRDPQVMATRWQQAYEALKKKYPPRKVTPPPGE